MRQPSGEGKGAGRAVVAAMVVATILAGCSRADDDGALDGDIPTTEATSSTTSTTTRPTTTTTEPACPAVDPTISSDGLSERGRSMSGEASLDPKRSAGIVTFVPRGNPERIRQELWSRGVVVRTRFGGLRLAPHHYQDDGDVARFFERYDAAEASI